MFHESSAIRPPMAAPLAFGSLRSEILGGDGYSHILIPTAMKPGDQSAVLLGLRMAASLGTKATLLHVAPSVQRASPSAEPSRSWHWLDAIDNLHEAWGSPAQSMTPANRREQSQLQLKAYLEREFPRHAPLSERVRAECRLGDVTDEIVRFADEQAADLVILSSRLSWRRLPIVPTRLHRLLGKMRKEVVVVRQDSDVRARS